VDAELVESDGKPGVWRFELGPGLAPGSVRILLGEALQFTDSVVVFRIRGTPGERVSFAFRTPD